ncbi:class I poly(R)-hydroxyalkanoic acid synthase [Photobacterium carnosum]|uniref:class I poly(R)-hydroxyalkanoic acid synthase n=1 Tax=Photobacterium carnosum TaxID=2023717 RepID=UPI001E5720C8|nr:class I poly(R)-hydroxyalkanoic acid synthase [Photobacterium carnosum]MCD9495038.1 class I poly(R)-hydroxyalkanoic acid synthase [Photobacterium carnosum]MCD9516499.1 class I poly(R)-hydroxyalkanoic acid synthase [Photobacterium carnosum]MCD9521942.1 class I poly(R)-hydroxyalkanoic acid synthase [Photobacterium carnosum]MCD9525372.1 class I poly(R)-hydroxyalkanoic acid synthase [Photobacterium carnosum]MCD9545336.1 class I poly(R)-hydroxyalkanoic acid synthase [Photobacterium carnosum]
MNNHFFSDYFARLQDMNQLWLKELDSGKAAMNTPVTKALNEMSLEDTTQFLEKAAAQPGALAKVHMDWWENQLKIWQNVAAGNTTAENAIIKPAKEDKRFDDPAWENEAFYNYIKQSYLLFSDTMRETIDSIEGVDDKAKERLGFFSRQAINALSPTNFVITNPELAKLTVETNGENLIKGMELFQEDMKSSADVLKIRMTNDSAFELGVNIACTEGSVVFKNELFELIQYKPLTETVNKTPLLVVPPFINKYYILDLREHNSMVRWLVEQGHTVFMMSWRNPDESSKDVDFDHYVLDGVVKAIDAIEDITGQKQINAVGYCIGGTLLATTLAYCAAKRLRNRIKSATFFTTLLDFSQPGEIGAYINDPIITAIEAQNDANGYMDGRSLSVTFSLLRENSLYWNYYINNYLKGNSPLDFDLLYWNGDSTNVASKCHSTLLRQFYLENKLVEKKGYKVGGIYIDLSKIKVPTYFISTQEDHIALWQGTYRGAKQLGGKSTFVLGESGHIAGIVNHPQKNKYGFWVNDSKEENAEAWFAGAKRQDGSWWTHWNVWLTEFSPAEQVQPYEIGSETYASLSVAPGDYVKQRLPISES